MKRAGRLMPSIITADNMRLAFVKTIRGKRHVHSVVEFRKELDNNLRSLAEEIAACNRTWGPYYRFTIFDPKERTISVAPLGDRVAHHALMNVCEPFFERYQIFDSYASRKGKGQFAALERARTFCRRNTWFLKLDVRKYFDSISHNVLKKLLLLRFKDVFVLENFEQIIDSYESATGCGVPIGNLTSQYFANHYLATMDHFVKEHLKVGCYVRYMDDFVFWNDNLKVLKRVAGTLQNFVRDELRLSLKTPIFNRCSQGMTFLGFRIFPEKMVLSHRSRYRFRRKLRTMTEYFESGNWDELTYSRRLETLFAFVRHAHSEGFRRRAMQEVGIDPQELEPCESGRELEQQRQELPVCESEQQRPVEPEQQPWHPHLPSFALDGEVCAKQDEFLPCYAR